MITDELSTELSIKNNKETYLMEVLSMAGREIRENEEGVIITDDGVVTSG
jgi:hypothetical protein